MEKCKSCKHGAYLHAGQVYFCLKSECEVERPKECETWEPKLEGKWLRFANSDDCPFCGYSTGKYERGRNYCPECGARLE